MNKKGDRIIKKIIDHEEHLARIEETIATKNDMNRVMNVLDEIVTITKRLDQERVFSIEWVRRVEQEVKKHTREITKIKRTLKID